MKIITVSREFGSGGRELGKRLSDCLGWPYYDREIISAVARRNALDEGYVEDALEQGDFRGVPLTIGRTFAYLPSMPHDSRQLLQEQRRVLRGIVRFGTEKHHKPISAFSHGFAVYRHACVFYTLNYRFHY